MNACPVAAGAVSTGTWPSLVGHLTGGQGVAGSNPAVPTDFRTLVPRTGNESSHDRSHLAQRDEQSIQGGDYAVLTIALPRWRGSGVRHHPAHGSSSTGRTAAAAWT